MCACPPAVLVPKPTPEHPHSCPAPRVLGRTCPQGSGIESGWPGASPPTGIAPHSSIWGQRQSDDRGQSGVPRTHFGAGGSWQGWASGCVSCGDKRQCPCALRLLGLAAGHTSPFPMQLSSFFCFLFVIFFFLFPGKNPLLFWAGRKVSFSSRLSGFSFLFSAFLSFRGKMK